MKTQLGTTIECALAGLFDYAGMFPPAELDLRAALREYLKYRRDGLAWALGSLVIDARALSALRDVAQGSMRDLRLSVLAADNDVDTIEKHLAEALPIAAIELKVEELGSISRWNEILSSGVVGYVEAPLEELDSRMLDAINEAGMHTKLRTGGVVAEAFPATAQVAAALKELAERRMAFKATAGLHHPLRARHAFTNKPDSPSGPMHGFVNLLCASALVWFGGEAAEAAQLLEDEDRQSWQLTAESIRWRAWSWSAPQLREVRERFLKRIGSCSFTEPIADLEAMGWL